jgi:lipoprotein-anchoring transpeptidase ErfK/SrfK
VSAGAPETPTPQGHFKIFEKLQVQDMRGYNANGTKYFQPHVRWVGYFSGSNAIHGNYWRPLSWFGNRNSSHGCVSVPDDQAKWVYNWAPVGTPVVVHS